MHFSITKNNKLFVILEKKNYQIITYRIFDIYKIFLKVFFNTNYLLR